MTAGGDSPGADSIECSGRVQYLPRFLVETARCIRVIGFATHPLGNNHDGTGLFQSVNTVIVIVKHTNATSHGAESVQIFIQPSFWARKFMRHTRTLFQHVDMNC